MHRYIQHIALILLLLFSRAMVPDELIQELHPHTHTVHTEQADPHKPQIGLKHKHCQVEDVFNTPYQGEALSLSFTTTIHTAVYATAYTRSWQGSKPGLYFLRGPPVA
ncbi:hypothetical protein [Pontibacter anaerobius]|uniref:Uncharacterized protein n=1 Tax=Pontibacter anaerobius TaxID=2993940 RepID=A0ABT3RJC3_9BACT|nr:hypothetical protein [Pontibacter anaerobius]MCX2741914.1 hypothetical protein [Pontibacter anaerobius]